MKPRALLFLFALSAAAEPIRLHPANPHYFLFNGHAVALVTSGEHYGSVMNTDFDYRRYLATLHADGLNYTRIFGGSYREVAGKSFGILRNPIAPADGKFLAPWARSAAPGYAAGGNKFDLDQWNPDFFTRYRAFLAEAARQGIVVEVTLFSSHYAELQWSVSALNPANNANATDNIDWKKLHTLQNGNLLARQESYTRKLVREANAFDNVIFEIQNEPWSDRPHLVDAVNPYLRPPARDTYPNAVEVADSLSMEWQTRVAAWIRDEESHLPKRHLVAENYCNFRFPVQNLVPGVDIVNFHYAYPEAATWNYGLGKALAYDETGFLPAQDALYLREAWNFMLSGGSIFDSLDYSFTVGHEDGSDTAPNGPGGGSPGLRRQLGVLTRFLAALPLAEMRLDQQTAIHAYGARARALSSPSGHYAIYVDSLNGAPAAAKIELSLPKGEYTGQWIDPATGTVIKQERVRQAGGTVVLTAPNSLAGAALRLHALRPGTSR